MYRCHTASLLQSWWNFCRGRPPPQHFPNFPWTSEHQTRYFIIDKRSRVKSVRDLICRSLLSLGCCLEKCESKMKVYIYFFNSTLHYINHNDDITRSLECNVNEFRFLIIWRLVCWSTLLLASTVLSGIWNEKTKDILGFCTVKDIFKDHKSFLWFLH